MMTFAVRENKKYICIDIYLVEYEYDCIVKKRKGRCVTMDIIAEKVGISIEIMGIISFGIKSREEFHSEDDVSR